MSLFSCKWDFLFIFFDGLNYLLIICNLQILAFSADILTTCQKLPEGFSVDGCRDGAGSAHT